MLVEIQRQSAEISTLKSQLQSLLPQSEHVAALDRLAGRVASLDARVGRLEEQVAVPYAGISAAADLVSGAAETAGNRSTGGADGSRGAAEAKAVTAMTLGQLTSLLSVRLEGLERRAGGGGGRGALASRAEVQALHSDAVAKAVAAAKDAAESSAPRTAVATLSEAQDALSASVSAVQGLLATKVDRTDLLRLQTVANDLTAFSAWKQAASADIRDLASRSQEQRAALDQSLGSIASLGSMLDALASATAKRAEAAEVQALASDLRGELHALARASESGGAAQSSRLAAAEARVGAAEESLARLGQAQQTGAEESERRSEALAEGLRGEAAALASSLRSDLQRLEREVEARALGSALEAANDGATQVAGAVDALARKVDVCLRFIEWFADRGEAYEYNASALERHMNALAVGNKAGRVVPGAAAGAGPSKEAAAAYARLDGRDWTQLRPAAAFGTPSERSNQMPSAAQ
jgi:hypothetical protein